jgi:hypothetical protein
MEHKTRLRSGGPPWRRGRAPTCSYTPSPSCARRHSEAVRPPAQPRPGAMLAVSRVPRVRAYLPPTSIPSTAHARSGPPPGPPPAAQHYRRRCLWWWWWQQRPCRPRRRRTSARPQRAHGPKSAESAARAPALPPRPLAPAAAAAAAAAASAHVARAKTAGAAQHRRRPSPSTWRRALEGRSVNVAAMQAHAAPVSLSRAAVPPRSVWPAVAAAVLAGLALASALLLILAVPIERRYARAVAELDQRAATWTACPGKRRCPSVRADRHAVCGWGLGGDGRGAGAAGGGAGGTGRGRRHSCLVLPPRPADERRARAYQRTSPCCGTRCRRVPRQPHCRRTGPLPWRGCHAHIDFLP